MRYLPLLAVILMILSCGTSQPAAGTESYIRPGYEKVKYKQILVIATMKDIVGRRKAENAMVDLLNRSGYHGTASYPVVDLNTIKHIDTLKAVLAPVDFDAVIVLNYLGQSGTINDKVSLNPTTPVASLSYFEFYTSPAYDFSFDSESRKSGLVQASFFTKAAYQKEWNSMVQVNADNGVDIAVEILAGMTLSRLKRDKIL
ncbi:hypothetical protein [Flavihumibacter petaseus]|uniref:DUF4136 domain-containing protein n=1 Tax=Flavihumibacter petaseus NBRC 106054 TaxID=1220578 RepID=A0A0E9MUT9_9BACT|nr:hypothetical protein [Flavihumibacter petaseus]GAO41258.1 hypothetical protein FPE01S_01_02700 [Flavihumibacter petaseus NBRC 106054]